ncbi:MAG: hypothetical protein MR219_01000 [Clostridiales bacterium]|nr:hypothetical protein [Clostridiales bacterium]
MRFLKALGSSFHGGSSFLVDSLRGGNEKYDSFLEPKKESKKAACDAKVKLIKLEGGTAAPVAGKNLNRPVWSKLRPRVSAFFPYGLASPALR